MFSIYNRHMLWLLLESACPSLWQSKWPFNCVCFCLLSITTHVSVDGSSAFFSAVCFSTITHLSFSACLFVFFWLSHRTVSAVGLLQWVIIKTKDRAVDVNSESWGGQWGGSGVELHYNERWDQEVPSSWRKNKTRKNTRKDTVDTFILQHQGLCKMKNVE